jgi:type IV secretion system protein VirB10
MLQCAVLLTIFAQASEPAATQPEAPVYRLETGTKIPLSLWNTVSTKSAIEGDRIYLDTIFPIIVNGKIVVPVGSSVAGTVTSVKRAGRVKGRAELFVRFDSLILPNGVVRDFRARVSNVDGTNPGKLDRQEGKIEGDGNKGGDAKTVGEVAVTGTVIGAIAGSAAGHTGLGSGIGAAAGATAAMIGILASRGPDAVLAKGTTVEMVLDRNLSFTEQDLDFRNAPAPARRSPQSEAPRQSERPGWKPFPVGAKY